MLLAPTGQYGNYAAISLAFSCNPKIVLVDDDTYQDYINCIRTLEESTDTVLAMTAPHPSSNAFFITA